MHRKALILTLAIMTVVAFGVSVQAAEIVIKFAKVQHKIMGLKASTVYNIIMLLSCFFIVR